jgi:hypothetical protein
MSPTRGHFVWFELSSTDQKAAKAFYSSVVGWRTQDVPMLSGTYTLLFADDHQVGGLMPLSAQARLANVEPAWVGYISVEDVDASVARLLRLGGRVLHAPVDIPGTGRSAKVSDPQGAVFNLFNPLRPLQPLPPHQAGTLGWRELHTADWPAAMDFYSSLLGWVKAQTHDMGPMGRYQVFSTGQEGFGGMFNSPAAKSAEWLYYFQVIDVDAAAQRILAGGGALTQPPHEVPGGGWVLHALDPQGTKFALLGRRIPS